MDKVLIEVSHHKILFSEYREKLDSEFSSITKNGINKILTTKDYINKKNDLFITFINQTNSKNKIEEIYIDKYSLTALALDMFKDIDIIPLIHFNEKANLPEEIYEKINSLNIKVLECYSMPKEMFEKLNNKGIEVKIENTLLFNSRLMNNNNFQTYDDLYNKEVIDIDFNPDDDDLDDLNNFLKINQELHVINIKNYYDGIVQNILKVLIMNKEEDVTINIYEHNEDIIKELPHFKKLQKKIKKHFKLKIVYSKEYKKKHFFKNFFIKFMILVFILGIIVLGYFLYKYLI